MRLWRQRKAERRTALDVSVDTVDTDTDLSHEISIRGIAYDNSGNFLWLHGYSYDTNKRTLLKVNSNAEPDVLISAVDLDISIRSMSWEGTHLWALTSTYPPVIVRIDPTTAQSTATYIVPDRTVNWYGIASTGSQIFLLGSDSSNKGIIISITP